MGIKIFGIFVTVMVAAATIAGLILAGSPATERERRFDEQRVSDLRQIAAAVDLYYSKTGQLPASLNDLTKPDVARLYYIRSITDPETGAPYEYSANSKSSYKLCAKFTYASIKRNPYQDNNAWVHPAGDKCFELLSPPPKANITPASPSR